MSVLDWFLGCMILYFKPKYDEFRPRTSRVVPHQFVAIYFVRFFGFYRRQCTPSFGIDRDRIGIVRVGGRSRFSVGHANHITIMSGKGEAWHGTLPKLAP